MAKPSPVFQRPSVDAEFALVRLCASCPSMQPIRKTTPNSSPLRLFHRSTQRTWLTQNEQVLSGRAQQTCPRNPGLGNVPGQGQSPISRVPQVVEVCGRRAPTESTPAPPSLLPALGTIR